MAQEVDEDLTMIQPEASLEDKSLIDLSENIGKSDPPPASPQEDMSEFSDLGEVNFLDNKSPETYIKGLQDSYLADSALSEGAIDPELDANKSMFESSDAVRSRNQSEAIKGLKAVGGGILQGGLIALEQAGYIPDLKTYTNMFSGAEDFSGNWWTKIMKNAQEGLRDSEAFKIYEESPDPNSLAAQIFKWTSLEGAVSSAVGFGITGLGAAKLVSTLGSLGKFKQLAAITDKTIGNLAGIEAAGITKAYAGPLASSAISNYFMGQMMATDTYNQTMESLKSEIDSGKISARKAQEVAAQEAQDVVSLNMALTATAYIKFGGIFKRNGKLKALVENPTAFNQMKNLIKSGSPTAFTENVYQEMIQMEQIYDTRKALGEDSQYSDTYWDRMSQLALSDRALHAGALGVVGGPIQFALIQRPMMGKQLAKQRENYQEQQKRLTWQQALVENNFKTFTDYTDTYNKAIVEGDIEAAKFIDDSQLMFEISKSAEWGTLAHLKKDIQDIIKSKETPEGYDENYKDVGADLITSIEKAERVMSLHSGKANMGAIVHYALLDSRAHKELIDTTVKIVENTNIAKEALETQFPGYKVEYSEGKFKFVLEPTRFDKLSEAQTTTKKAQEIKDRADLKALATRSLEVQELKRQEKHLGSVLKFKTKVQDAYNTAISPEAQQKFVEDQAKKASEAVENLEKVDEVKEKESNFVSFKEIRENPNPLTTDELAAKNKEYDESLDDTKVNVIANTSFTGVDSNQVAKIFTPGEIRRSVDGRLFKVISQVNGNKSDYSSTAQLPFLYEVDEKYKKMSKIFALEDNSFLRDESLQPTILNGIATNGYAKYWGKYTKADTLLKPNDLAYQMSIKEKAANGVLSSLNISARRLKTAEFEWLKDYAIEELNKPFKEPYDVVFKLNKVGVAETYVDVYRVDKDGTETKLTRLSREGNVNHEVVIKMLVENKGILSGRAIEHFSTKYNINKDYNEDGTPVVRSIEDLKHIHPDYLPGGKVILASTKGHGPKVYEPLDIARDLDGNFYEGGTIDVNGITQNIPYESMRVGDTYVLLVAPSGMIVPAALNTGKLKDLKSNIGGESFVDDVIKSMYDGINIVKEANPNYFNTPEQDRILREGFEFSNKTGNPQIVDQLVANSKRKALKKKLWDEASTKEGGKDAAWIAWEDTVFRHIRPNMHKTLVYGTDEKGNDILEKTRRGKNIIADSYLKPVIAVSKSTKEYVPGLEVKASYDGTKVEVINIVDHADRFKERLGELFKKNSIYSLADTNIEGKQAMSNFIAQSGASIDINLSKPFIGSSATFEVLDESFKERSAQAAMYKERDLASRFGKELKAFGSIRAEDTQELKQAFAEKLVEDFDDNSDWLGLFEEVTTVDKVHSMFREKVNTLGIKEQKVALKILDDYMKAVPEDATEEYENAIELLKSTGVGPQIAEIAKGMLAVKVIADMVADGELTLENKYKKKSAEDPSGKYTQPEGFSFPKGALIFHEEFGDATVKVAQSNSDSRMKIELKNGKVISVFPSVVYSRYGDYAELQRTINKLANLDESSTQFNQLVKVKNRLERSIQRKLVKDGKEDEGVPTEEEDGNTDNVLLDYINKSDYAYVFSKVNLEKFGSTKRAKEVVNKLDLLEKMMVDVVPRAAKSEDVSEQDVVELRETIVESIPYSNEELDALISIAIDKQEAGGDASFYNGAIGAYETLKNIKNGLTGNPDIKNTVKVSSRKWHTSKFLEGNYVIPGFNVGADFESIKVSIGRLQTMLAKAVATETDIHPDLFIGATKTVPVSTTVKVPTKPVAVPTPKPSQVVQSPVTPPQARTQSVTIVKGTPKPVQPVVSHSKVLLRNGIEVPSDIAEIVNSDQLMTIEKDEFMEEIEALDVMGSSMDKVFEKFRKDYGPKFKEGDNISNTEEQFNSEVQAVKKMLPQLDIEIVENLTSMFNKYGKKAIGAYHQGVVELVQNAKKGTVYHEAFHAVADLYLSEVEKAEIVKERGVDKWTIELEEQLADDFAKHVGDRTYKKSNLITRFFKAILNYFNKTRGQGAVVRVFEKVATGGYATKPSVKWLENSSPIFNSINQFKDSLSKKNSVLLQSLLDDNKIEIVC